MINRLPSATQTIYAELLERSIHFEAGDILGPAGSGSIVRKQIKGREYWYIQKSEGRVKRQLYVGPDSQALRSWIEDVREERENANVKRSELAQLSAMLVSGGVRTEATGVLKILEILREAEVFRLGGVLIGTVAYSTMGAMLGVILGEANLKTQDVDIAQEPALAVGFLPLAARGNVGEKLLGSDLGIQPIPTLDPRSPSTSYSVRSRDLRVDFLVPAVGKQSSSAVFLPAFGISATPLRFLEFLVESPIQAVVIGSRPVLVNVPDPSRFALHKVYTAVKRGVAFQTKAAKDLRQASTLIEVLAEDRPEDLARAWNALQAYPNVSQKVRTAIPRLREDAAARLVEIVGG